MKINLFCYLSSKEHHLLFHFLKHYKNLGVDCFYLTIDCHQSENLKKEIENITQNYNTKNTFVNKYTSNLKRDAANNFIRNRSGAKDWLVYVDLDEFINLNQSPNIKTNTLKDLAEYLITKGVKAIRGFMCDKVCPDNVLKEIDINSDISKSFSRYYPLSLLASPQVNTRKYPFFQADHGFSFEGSHGGKSFENHLKSTWAQSLFLVLDHYKWHKDSIEKIKDRIIIYGKSNARFPVYDGQLSQVNDIKKNGYKKKFLSSNFHLQLIPNRFQEHYKIQ